MYYGLSELCFAIILLIGSSYGGCGTGKRDIAFVIDESGSVGSSNYVKQLTFLQNVASEFTVGEHATLFGAVTFNDNARLAFSFDKYTSLTSLVSAIGSISYNPGGTSIGNGITFARQNLFTSANGDRSHADDYIVVITDGFSADTVAAGVAARAAGFTLFAVGVDGYDLNDLIGATGDVSKVFTAANYNSLDAVVGQLTSAFPCDYFCGNNVIGYGKPEDHTTHADLDVGYTFLMDDDVFSISCCGAIHTVEFVPTVSGPMEFHVWRKTGNSDKSYLLAAKAEITTESSQIGNVINHTLSNRIAIVDGDKFGWYSPNETIPSYSPCVGDTCPSYIKAIVLTRAPDSTYDWGYNNTVDISGRVYAIRIYTTNNSIPSGPLVTSRVVPDHITAGDVIMSYDLHDSDVADTLTHTLNHTYFSINMSTGQIVLKSILPRSYAKYYLIIKSTDSCQNSVTATVTITTYNSPPVLNNLPAIIFILENITAGEVVFHLDLVDLSSDPVCCSISNVHPYSTNFILNSSNEDMRIMISPNPNFDNKLVSSNYKITICCEDGIIATKNYLEVRVKPVSRTQQYKPPGWFNIAVAMSMVPITTLLMTSCVIMGMTCNLEGSKGTKNVKRKEEQRS